ncbi:MAG: lysylphosphatidylglycerol synthase transmembrane domain-containing protein [Planctomycetaceae bacterium]
MKRLFFLIFGIGVSVACFAASLRGTNIDELQTGFAQANYLTLPAMLGLLFAFYWMKTQRWVWLLSPVRQLTVRELFPPMLIGFAANNLLPAHLGEFVRVFIVRRRYGIPASTVLSTVVLERIFDVLAILAWFSIGLMYSADLPEEYRKAALFFGAASAAVVVCVAVYLIWTDSFLNLLRAVCRKVPFIPHSLSDKIVGMLASGAEGLSSLRSGKMVLMITVSSLVQWLFNGMIAWVALRAFGIPVTFATGMIVTGVTAMGVTIPSTPGYFGVIQICFKVAMGAQAVKPDPSLVLGASLYYHVSMYIPVTTLGMYFLHQSGLNLKDLSKAAVDSEPQAPAEKETNPTILLQPGRSDPAGPDPT